jgi:hypothetical protein
VEWADRVEGVLRRAHVTTVNLIRAPIRDFGGFEWYSVPPNRLPPTIDLVVCDGPVSAETKGGRYGLWPVLGERFAPSCEILLDDVARQDERVVLERWAAEFGATYTLHGVQKPYAVLVTQPGAGRPETRFE